jgi:hypothetical protein
MGEWRAGPGVDAAFTLGHVGWVSQEDPLPQLRFKAGVLQQAWRRTEWLAGVCQSHTIDWRDVPSED